MKSKGNSGNAYIGRAMVLRSIGFKTYADYLASPLWADIRERVFVRDKRTCRICSGPGHVAHHNRYLKKTMLGKTAKSLKHIVCLCHDCHRHIEFDCDGNKESSLTTVRNKFEKLSQTKPTTDMNRTEPNPLQALLLDSCVWGEPHATKIVWITLLLKADPFDGVVHRASVAKLARWANVTIDECIEALEYLGGPDKFNNQSPDPDGRHIVAYADGWRIFAYDSFRPHIHILQPNQ